MVYTLGYEMVLIFETNIEKTGECVGTDFGLTLICATECCDRLLGDALSRQAWGRGATLVGGLLIFGVAAL